MTSLLELQFTNKGSDVAFDNVNPESLNDTLCIRLYSKNNTLETIQLEKLNLKLDLMKIKECHLRV